MSNIVEKSSNDILETAKEYLSSLGCNIQEKHKVQFLEICKNFKLNPFAREIYAVPYGNNFNIIVGYETYIKRAELSGRLAGWRAYTEGEGASLKGVVEISRKDWQEPFKHEVYFNEYNQNNTMWKTKPRTMIKKVAIAQGFRMAFPCELGGMPYTSDEIPLQNDFKAVSNDLNSSFENALNGNIEKTKENPALILNKLLKEKGLNTNEIKEFCKKYDINSKDVERCEDLTNDLDLLEKMILEFKNQDLELEILQ